VDLQQTLQALYTERARPDQVIAALEDLRQHNDGIPTEHRAKRRGRKFMSPEEWRKVSERMKRYWASRRAPHLHREAKT
jgi:hypothetical protein